jgi:hypothetical protein
MKSEEELQNQIEKGWVTESGDDARAYQRVFDALKKEPDFHVSLPFADRIIAIINKREEKRDYWWIAIGIFLAVIAMIVSLVLTSAHWSTGVFTFLSGYPGLVAFGITFILILQWVDKKVIKKKIDFGNL